MNIFLIKEKVDCETVTSLELLKQVNHFREMEGNRKELKHDTLLKIIRKEFGGEEYLGLENISESSYVNSQNKEQPMYILPLEEAKRVLLRESSYVRGAVLKYIQQLELAYMEVVRDRLEREEVRQLGKVTRREFTDVLQKLVEYAKEQGSKNSNMFYIIYSKLIKKVVGYGEREMATKQELKLIDYIEGELAIKIESMMTNKFYYKEIYKEMDIFLEPLCMMKEQKQLNMVDI